MTVTVSPLAIFASLSVAVFRSSAISLLALGRWHVGFIELVARRLRRRMVLNRSGIGRARGKTACLGTLLHVHAQQDTCAEDSRRSGSEKNEHGGRKECRTRVG